MILLCLLVYPTLLLMRVVVISLFLSITSNGLGLLFVAYC